ncbi:hypothetical protein PR002_g15948 [Phytophthora rubi]|uniref:Uncharacterized protein n=1 Tax=Phytophthora rubi TaxID=129364 RepID=A0A6A3KXA7_9STRA|nr:hypothetical protein PR002_g15948 [Phytophthora rubi]
MAFRGMGVCAGMVASFNLLNAWAMRHPPVAFFTQNVGLECGEILASLAAAFEEVIDGLNLIPRCRVTQYFNPGTRSISCRTPRSAGSSAGIFSGKMSSNSRASG